MGAIVAATGRTAGVICSEDAGTLEADFYADPTDRTERGLSE